MEALERTARGGTAGDARDLPRKPADGGGTAVKLEASGESVLPLRARGKRGGDGDPGGGLREAGEAVWRRRRSWLLELGFRMRGTREREEQARGKRARERREHGASALIHARGGRDVARRGVEAASARLCLLAEEEERKEEKEMDFSGKPPGYLGNLAIKSFSIKTRELNRKLRPFLKR